MKEGKKVNHVTRQAATASAKKGRLASGVWRLIVLLLENYTDVRDLHQALLLIYRSVLPERPAF